MADEAVTLRQAPNRSDRAPALSVRTTGVTSSCSRAYGSSRAHRPFHCASADQIAEAVAFAAGHTISQTGRSAPERYRNAAVAEVCSLATARAGIRLVPAIVDGVNDFESAFATMAKERAQAVIVVGYFDPHRKVLLDLAAKRRLAYMSSNRETVVAGALVSLSSNYSLLYERSAYYVDKIIKGARPGDLPVEQPTKLQAVINLKAAHALGLTISPALLAQIDEIIE